jgi:hypothetical protein
MIWYVLGTVVVVFGGVALLIFLALSSNRGISVQPQPPLAPQPQGDTDRQKWGKRIGWGVFGFILLDVYRKIFGNLPVELKEWTPSFSWNTFEVLVLIAGVAVLWSKTRKKSSGSGTAQGGSGIVVTGIADTHNPPPVMYGGVPQVKWATTIGESVWNAVAIPLAILGILVLVFYMANEVQGLENLKAWARSPISLSKNMAFLLVANGILAFTPKGKQFFVLWGAVIWTVFAYHYIAGWFTLWVSVYAIKIAFPAIVISFYILWKSRFVDWMVPGIYVFLWAILTW